MSEIKDAAADVDAAIDQLAEALDVYHPLAMAVAQEARADNTPVSNGTPWLPQFQASVGRHSGAIRTYITGVSGRQTFGLGRTARTEQVEKPLADNHED